MDEPMTMTPLQTAAMTSHELFLNFREAGFTEDQALKIVIGMLTANGNINPEAR